jgi:hypothetical protein
MSTISIRITNLVAKDKHLPGQHERRTKIVNGILGAVVVGLQAETAPQSGWLGDSNAIPTLRSVAWEPFCEQKESSSATKHGHAISLSTLQAGHGGHCTE